MDLVFKDVRIPDFGSNRFHEVNVGVRDGVVARITRGAMDGRKVISCHGAILSPGLVDCHCHIESSYLLPSLFGRLVASKGTLYAVADCHEIANVAGRRGLEFFMEDGGNGPCELFFAVPSCVPASPFGTSGGIIDAATIKELLRHQRVLALGELMNIPAVLDKESDTVAVIEEAKRLGKRVNGHAPGLTGQALEDYFAAGIEDDHESEDLGDLGMKLDAGAVMVFLREGSAEHSRDDAYGAIERWPGRIGFCTDDKSVNDILDTGHIDHHLRRAVELGVDPVLALKAASHDPLQYYGLGRYAAVAEGAPANLVLFADEQRFEAAMVVKDGVLLEEWPAATAGYPGFLADSFAVDPIEQVPSIPEGQRHLCIGAVDKSLLTRRVEVPPDLPDYVPSRDLAKLVVVERYGHGRSSACRITGFGMTRGALASSLAHDCHNVICAGTSDEAVKIAVDRVIEAKGGLVVFDGSKTWSVPLPVGGIVSNMEPAPLAEALASLKERARTIAPGLSDPLSTLTFMALEVIPHLKLTDQGLFDVDNFALMP